MGKKTTYYGKNYNKLQEGRTLQERIIVSAETRKEYEEGKVILINKDIHWTSFDAIKKIRGALRIKKVGHAGTLDPLASGLLIICTGKFTKKINEYMAKEKEYTGSFTLGATTPTYDLESEPVSQKDFSFVTEDLLKQTTRQFIGDIEQLPPAYSAVKKDGVHMYDLARKGVEMVREPRKVTISDFQITSIALPIVEFKVVCSTGTYIRSLANDFGEALGCGAYLSSLCRTRIGEFSLSEATRLDAFLASIQETPDTAN